MITIYGFDPKHFHCAPCINAKRFCEMKGYTYNFIPVSSDKVDGEVIFDEVVLKQLATRLNRESTRGLSMPQIFTEHEGQQLYIGGFSDLRTWDFK